jgi:hypothetical protein
MTTRWIDNFKKFTMEQWLGTCSFLKVEEKFVKVESVIKDNIGGEDVERRLGLRLVTKGWTLKDDQGNKSEEYMMVFTYGGRTSINT